MSTTKATTENGIDKRTKRACEGCMVVVPEGDASGLSDVYSATDGKNEIYTVDLRAETCGCADYKHRQPAGGCKHIRRVKLGLGIMPLPADPSIDVDGALEHDREKYGVDVDPEPLEPTAHTPDSSGQEAVADGGQLIEAPDDGVILDEEDDEEEKEQDTDEESELRSAAHTIALDAYDANPLPDFDVFGEIISCSTDSVRRALETEAGR
jgi:hypothetical protein